MLVAVLAYALAVLLGWLVAPLVLPPAPLPLTRPLSAALLAALAAVALRDHGAATRRGSQVTALAVVAVAVASAITDIVGVSTLVVSYGNPWQPYLGDSRLWASIWSAIPLALAGGSLLVARSRPRIASAMSSAGVFVAYVSVLSWSAGSTLGMTLRDGVGDLPGTQIATIAVCIAASRHAGLPRAIVRDAPDARTARRWDALLFGALVLPVVLTLGSNAAARSPLGLGEGSALIGVIIAGSLLAAVAFYVRADRQAREHERYAMEQAEHQALHDHLTGLANRTLALEVLGRALARTRRSEGAVTVLFCDLDGLKRVNDAFGHAVGDVLIRSVAERLRHAVREEDTVARLGGDEFLVISERLNDDHERAMFAERVLAAVAEPLSVDGLALKPGISVGIATARHGERPLDVIQNADVAMYRAKADGRGRWVVFDPRMRAEHAERMRIEAQLRHAFQEGRIVAWFQPIVRLQDRVVVGAEALVRWEDSRRGTKAPAGWLDIAEHSGLLPQVGRSVITSACAQLAGSTLGFVSVNLGARELARADLSDWCLKEVARWGIEPRRLAFEVSEASLAQAGPHGRDQLERLVGEGFRLILGGFGSGPDTLATWRDLPVTGIKLDRAIGSTVHETGAARIAAVGAGIAAGLHITGIAEGIEDEEQVNRLQQLGWQFGQGYLLGRPGVGLPLALSAATR